MGKYGKIDAGQGAMNTKMKMLAIVMVTYNGIAYTLECIDSVMKSTFGNYTVVVVDNNSSDGTPDIVEERYDNRVIVIRQNFNTGFAKANNLGARYAIENGAKYILLLNNDTEIDNLMLETLWSSREEKCILAPKIYYFDCKNVIWFAGGKINKLKGCSEHVGLNCADNEEYSTGKEMEFATGCCMFMPSAIITDTELFDENYFMYLEDSDFCLRAKLAGYSIKYVPSAKMWHKVSSTSGKGTSKFQVYYNTRNRLYFVKKNRYYFRFLTFPYVLAFSVLRGIKGKVLNRESKYALQAIRDFFRGEMGINLDL